VKARRTFADYFWGFIVTVCVLVLAGGLGIFLYALVATP
jgi:hypothetical protein